LLKAATNEPTIAVRQWLWFIGELGKIAIGQSERSPEAGDRRFADAAWKSSKVHRGLLQAYLAWGSAVDKFVDRSSLGELDKTRARLTTTLLVDALAPTNALLTNPAALKQLVDSGGESLWRGLKNYLEDLVQNGGLPTQVKKSVFKVGENLYARRSGVRQSTHRAHPVYPDDRDGTEAATGHYPTANQQVLCDGFVA